MERRFFLGGNGGVTLRKHDLDDAYSSRGQGAKKLQSLGQESASKDRYLVLEP